jgi:predicted nucleic acid-binding protein
VPAIAVSPDRSISHPLVVRSERLLRDAEKDEKQLLCPRKGSVSHIKVTEGTLVPFLWFYEVGNGLLMACRRKPVSLDQVDGFPTRLKALPIEAAQQTPSEILELPALAQAHGLTNYDAAYLALALRFKLPLATADSDLLRAVTSTGVKIL